MVIVKHYWRRICKYALNNDNDNNNNNANNSNSRSAIFIEVKI